MSDGVPTRLHAHYFPQGKENLRQRFTQTELIARSKNYGGITKQMNFNYPRR